MPTHLRIDLESLLASDVNLPNDLKSAIASVLDSDTKLSTTNINPTPDINLELDNKTERHDLYIPRNLLVQLARWSTTTDGIAKLKEAGLGELH